MDGTGSISVMGMLRQALYSGRRSSAVCGRYSGSFGLVPHPTRRERARQGQANTVFAFAPTPESAQIAYSRLLTEYATLYSAFHVMCPPACVWTAWSAT